MITMWSVTCAVGVKDQSGIIGWNAALCRQLARKSKRITLHVSHFNSAKERLSALVSLRSRAVTQVHVSHLDIDTVWDRQTGTLWLQSLSGFSSCHLFNSFHLSLFFAVFLPLALYSPTIFPFSVSLFASVVFLSYISAVLHLYFLISIFLLFLYYFLILLLSFVLLHIRYYSVICLLVFFKNYANYKTKNLNRGQYKCFNFNSVHPHVVVEWLALFLRIREVPGSNLDPDTGSMDQFFLVVFFSSSRRIPW
jgi:hypothetical protein